MGLYTNLARGIWLLDNNTVTDPEQLRGHVDYIVGYAGIGDKPSTKFGQHYELAKLLDVPYIGYVSADAEIAVGWTLNPDKWPDAEHDPTATMCYRQTKYPNGTQRAVYGWIVDGSKYIQTDKKELTDGWVGEVFRHTLDRVYRRMRKPVYPLIKKETVSHFSKTGTLVTFISNQPSISTYEPALAANLERTGWSNHYIPGDNDAILQPYAPKWDFWWYGSAVLPGVTGGVPLFLSSKDRAGLYAELGFKPTGTTPPPVVDPPDDTNEDPADNDAVLARLDAVIGYLAAIVAELKRERTIK